MYALQEMDKALERCLRFGHVTVPVFMAYSELKRNSVRSYLDSICKGDHPRLWKIEESHRWFYYPRKETPKV